jgi:hypothetical protein
VGRSILSSPDLLLLDGQCLVAVYAHCNSAVVSGETLHWDRSTWDQLRSIPLAMAERIHPRVFAQVYTLVFEALADDGPAPPLPPEHVDHITSRAGFRVCAARCRWNADRRFGTAGWQESEPPAYDTTPHLGSGEPIPQPDDATDPPIPSAGS